MTADSLTIYAIQRTANGQRIDDFYQVIDPGRLGTVDDIRDFQSPENLRPTWSARMYLWQGETRRPSWVEFLEDGFGGDPIEVAGSAQDCAVVVVRVLFRVERLYAIPFGQSGRFKIRRDIVDPRYGLRVALNLLYQGTRTPTNSTPLPASTKWSRRPSLRTRCVRFARRTGAPISKTSI